MQEETKEKPKTAEHREDGKWELYTGVSDCEACVIEIDDPFKA